MACRWQLDLTSRFLQFGALENQCGQSYLAVPIASGDDDDDDDDGSGGGGSLPPPLRNRKARKGERKPTALHHA